MSNIIEELREIATDLSDYIDISFVPSKIHEAADEIEKLREALSRAKKLFLQDEPQKAFIELCAALGEKE